MIEPKTPLRKTGSPVLLVVEGFNDIEPRVAVDDSSCRSVAEKPLPMVADA